MRNYQFAVKSIDTNSHHSLDSESLRAEIMANSGDDIFSMSTGGLGCINPNPTFTLGDTDYTDYVDGTTRVVKHDRVDATAGAMWIEGKGGTMIGTNLLPVDITKEYRATVSIKSNTTGSDIDPTKAYRTKMYIGVKCYDSDNRFIAYQASNIYNDTQTTLAQDLNIGDTSVTINTATDPFYDGSTNHMRSIALHRLQPDGTQVYIGDNGRIYDPLGHTQWWKYGIITEGSYVDNGDGTSTFQLASAWAVGNFVAGDAIRNCKGGGTYNYWISGLNTDSNLPDWHRYSSTWEKTTDDVNDPTSRFRNGTAYCRMMTLLNYRLYEDGVIFTPTSTKNIQTSYSVLSLDWRHVP